MWVSELLFISGYVFFAHLVKRLPFSKGGGKKNLCLLCASDPNYANYQKFNQGPGLLSPNPEVIDSIKNAWGALRMKLPPLSVKRPPSSGKQLCYLFNTRRRSHFHGEGRPIGATSPASRGLFASRSARLNVAFWCGAQLLLLPDCQRHTEGSCWRKWQSSRPSPPLLSLIIELVIWKSPQARPSVSEGGRIASRLQLS